MTSTNIDATPASQNHGESADSVPGALSEAASDERSRRDWRSSYARRLRASDFLVLVWVVYGTQILWLGIEPPRVSGLDELNYWIFSAGLVVGWMVALGLIDSRDYRVIGTGTTEYVRVADASLRLFGLIAIAAFLLRVDIARGYLIIALPLGIGMLVLERYLWRQWLVAHRRLGEYSAQVLLVGSETSVAQIARELTRTSATGYRVVGACVPRGGSGATVADTDIPIVGSVDAVERAIAITGADTVAITSTDDLPPYKVKQISWELESGRQHLVLAPSIIDIAGPRIHSRPVSGLPLIHVETPRFSGGQRFTKRTFDILVSSLLIVVLSPVLLVVALAVKASDPGAVLFSHERIGRGGKPFSMLKFRSMRVGAEDELDALLKAQGTGEIPLFKVKDDPRVTPLGRFLRKYSIDELPQLWNVLAGSMSLVGPRPQIAAEVALYSDAARRRLLARPGITGLWQVSGRSELSWEDAVKLDLYYVENWSLLGDIAILMKTLKAVAAPGSSAR
ncbi:sugar transferase [Microbacterium kyungheense]|uniref:Undecaprenyl-phosphate galactose phosphotransferase WbaP/exopolysaccharide biosynthesis polyprenyl glycosylphosphotransferase n=1 Tax=Microbacterium kyungheense TaxID=1263636 RepID=A0A543FJQ9_9MICO|nr:sugar transferase [Microbacterium kyungheense]TQM34098.1 Undecaprenyl-phosphate galactose phosphotransferase WbaP/exopolysaccharide biosynthesis polyprenyl glycosylphosphotransferase [Microbacterium kyungheense]